MLETISVKNVALIDELSLDFNAHLNVLSGETGAGKSILIGALSFLLGGKVTADIIRTGTAEAAVSGTFYLANPKLPHGLMNGESSRKTTGYCYGVR